MKRLTLLTAYACSLSLFFTSCAVYQVNTISSTNTVHNEHDGSFTMENDSLQIIYSFAGQNAPISIEIHNKLNEPLIIDWQRSAITYNGNAVCYAGNTAQLNTSSYGVNYKWNSWPNNTSYTYTTGDITLPQYSDFIPPHSFIKRVPLQLMDVFIENIADTEFSKIKVPLLSGDETVNGKKAAFTQNNTPLVFNSYLTFTSSNSDKKTAYQQQFYISELVNIKTNPDNTALLNNRNDQFYLSRQTGYGKMANATGTAIAIGAISAAADPGTYGLPHTN